MNDWEDVARPVLKAIWELEQQRLKEPMTVESLMGVPIDEHAVQDVSGVKGGEYRAAVKRLIEGDMVGWQPS